MNYTYEFTKVSPKQLFVQVKYYSEGLPDQFRNISTKDFSEEGLQKVAESKVPSVVSNWEAIAAAPEEVVLTNTTVSKTYKPFVNLEQPDYDFFTERLEAVVTETETEVVTSWLVVELSEEEKQVLIIDWRKFASVTMRQTRLALMQEGKLEDVQAALDALPEPQKTTAITEWEYAATVERSSHWVLQLGSALGLDEEGLDELFKAAAVL